MSSRRNRGGGDGGHGGEERWLLPYADMITLLLGLFIVLFAMSSIDAKKFDNVSRSLSQTFAGQVLKEPGDVMPGASGVLQPEAANQTPDTSAVARLEEATDAARARAGEQARRISRQAKSAGLGNDVDVVNNERGIVVKIAGDALFDSGSSELRPDVRRRLGALEQQLRSVGRDIEIAGHTDGAPYPQPGGNWRLGADRALAVLVFFEQRGFPAQRMSARSRADTVPVVAPPPYDRTRSIAANRRIEITLLAPGADDTTPLEVSIARAARSGAPAGSTQAPVDPDVQAELDIIGELAVTTRELE